MIFVTVGTHEQPFDRIVEYIDKLISNGSLAEEVIMQTGFCTYEPKSCKWQKFFSYDEIMHHINNAHIVISHGGPSSFLPALQIGKIPIVVPRQKCFGEHVNDHQLDFARQVASRLKNIILIEDIADIEEKIKNYDQISQSIAINIKSNTDSFNERFSSIVKELMN